MSSANQNGYQKLLAIPQSSTTDDQFTPELWSSGLCDCCSDPELCCLTCLFPYVTFGRIAEAVDDGQTSCVVSAAIHVLLTYMTGYGWKYSCMYRSKMRKKYNLDGSSCNDCLIHSCCMTCGLCQEYREIQVRGAIVCPDDDKRKYGVEAVPVSPGGMTR